MEKTENRVPLGIKLPPSLIARVDKIRSGMAFPPDRTACIERATMEWCDRMEAEPKKAKK